MVGEMVSAMASSTTPEQGILRQRFWPGLGGGTVRPQECQLGGSAPGPDLHPSILAAGDRMCQRPLGCGLV